eukprot:362659-Ditylum_brightwellii.AAC.1
MIAFPDHVAIIVLVINISRYYGSILVQEGLCDERRKSLFCWVEGVNVKVADVDVAAFLHAERY